MFTALALLAFGWLAMLVLKSSIQAAPVTTPAPTPPEPARPWWKRIAG